MYLLKELWGEDMKTCAFDEPPFGPGFSLDQVAKAACLRVQASSFEDPGPDFTVFQLLDRQGQVLDEARIGGY